MIKLILKKIVSNDYSGSDWNYELTTKYVFEINAKRVEAGYFVHYLKQESRRKELSLVKEVIELPSSQGCSVKCAYCASSHIKEVQLLSEEEIYQIFQYIYEDNEIAGKNYLLVTMTGIGDYSLCANRINSVIEKINSKYDNIYFTISSSIWTDVAIDRAVELSKKVNLRTINITYISHDRDKVRKVIKNYELMDDYFERIIYRFSQTNLSQFRINYIMIKGINDCFSDYEAFVRICEPMKERLKTRISKLHNTFASKKAKLITADYKTLLQFQEFLEGRGYHSYLFYSYKEDQMNCGQLLTERLDCMN